MFRRIPALVAVLLLAGCTASPETPSNVDGPPSAEERLTFVWEEAVDVPQPAREAVAFAQEWEHAYYLNVAQPSRPQPMIEQHTDPALLDEIRRAFQSAQDAGGVVRVTLMETAVEETGGWVGVCTDTRSFGLVGPDGRTPTTSGTIDGLRLRVRSAVSGGAWAVQEMVFQVPDLDARCVASGGPPPTTTPA